MAEKKKINHKTDFHLLVWWVLMMSFSISLLHVFISLPHFLKLFYTTTKVEILSCWTCWLLKKQLFSWILNLLQRTLRPQPQQAVRDSLDCRVLSLPQARLHPVLLRTSACSKEYVKKQSCLLLCINSPYHGLCKALPQTDWKSLSHAMPSLP